jgi:tyrocidine synthetase-3
MRADRPISSRLTAAAAQNIKEKNYWIDKLSGGIIKSSFPGDYSKRAKQTRHPAVISKVFPGELFSRLLELSKGSDVRLYITMVGAVSLLLNRYMYNRQEDIVLGTSIYRQEMEADFINTVLVLRSTVNPILTFKEFLMQVAQVIREADLHQNYPIEALLRLLNMNPAADEDFPLFDVAVLLENLHDKRYLSHIHLNIIFVFKRNNEGMEVMVEYNSMLYKKNTIERIISHFFNLLENALFNVSEQLSQIDVLSDEEKKEILFGFNDTNVEYPRDKTLHQLFEEQAIRTPGNIAIIYGRKGLTYGQLNERANRLAWELRKRGLKPNRFAAVIMDRSIEMIIGVMAILKAGGAYVPLEPYLPDARITACLSSLDVESLLTNRFRLNRIVPISEQLPQLKHIICLDDIQEKKEIKEIFKNKEAILTGEIEKNSGENLVPAASPLDIAYVIFTSGTTGTPKGVVMQHRPVINVIQWVNKTFDVNSPDRLIFVVSLGFDLSVYDIFGILSSGASIRVAGNEEIKSPERLVEIIFNEEITFWDSAPAALQMLVPYLPHPLTRTGFNIDKSKLRLIFLSGDWIPVTMPDILKETFAGVSIVSLGGATEAAIWSNFFFIETVDPEWVSIPYGKPLQNARYFILDRYLNPCPIGVPGDLYIGGECLAQGYFNDETLTAKKFIINPFVPGEKMYKTGDLARWFTDGNMEFLGRMDNQVKIRGYRIELGEIESCLSMYDNINDALVIARSDGGGKGDKYLCAYYTADFVLDTIQLSQHLSKTLPDYMIPAYFVKIEHMPLTPNGKIDRKALPKPGSAIGTGEYTAPRGEIEETLVEIWSDILGLDEELIGIDSDFFELGGHSLSGTELLAKIHKALDIKLALLDLFRLPTIRELAKLIKRTTKKIFDSINSVEEKEYYVLSSVQRRLYILQQLDLNSTAYNVPVVVVLEGELDGKKLEETFKILSNRHESLRTSFIIVEDTPMQKIHREIAFEIQYYDASQVDGIIKRFIKPFDFLKAPLMRVGLIKINPMRHLLMVDLHHIITDGISQNILLNDFLFLYNDIQLPLLRLQYNDYSEWQQNPETQNTLSKQEKFWLKEFDEEIPVLNIVTDYSRPPLQSVEGNSIPFEIGEEETTALNEMARLGNATLFMVLLAIYNIFLSKISAQENIVVGTPIAGRRHDNILKIVGMFVNTLAINAYPSGEKTFKEFLNEIIEITINAFENQDYQFVDLVEKIAIQRDMSRNPIFDTMFVLENTFPSPGNLSKNELADLKIKPYQYESRTAKFDLSLNSFESEGKLYFSIEYCTKLFRDETIIRFIDYFKRIIRTVIDAPGKKISGIEITSVDDRRQLLYDFNVTTSEYQGDKTIHRIFEEQVLWIPDDIAVIGPSVMAIHESSLQITYKELNEKSNRLAHILQSKGVGVDTIIGIMMERSVEMIIGILGISKAGGAYLPIDPYYPGERIYYMLKDSSSKILLTSREIANLSLLQAFNNSPKCTSSNLHLSPAPVTSLAYIIYTSGSTGKPKGVMIGNRSVVNLLLYLSKEYPVLPGDTYLLKTSYTFDVSVTEIFGWFPKGGRLAVLEPGAEKDPERIMRMVHDQGITHINFVPSMFNVLVDFLNSLNIHWLSSLKYIFLAGEALSPRVINKCRKLKSNHCLENIYGPTETTIYASRYSLSGWDGGTRIPIGKPLQDVKLYILSKYNNLQPIGIVGELCISGIYLARGYLNSPELTAEKFCLRRPGGRFLKKLPREASELPRKNFLLGVFYRSYTSHMSYISYLSYYKTGDLARWLPDGNIEFFGRADNQVKIRGFRIELGEIENRLLNHPGIKETVVSTQEDENGEKYLCAYIVSAKDYVKSALQGHLAKELPDYMIPSYFMQIEKIPLTPNGKIDRRALPKPELNVGENYIAPTNKTEKKLAALWSEILGRDAFDATQLQTSIGIDDNFFRLGGHSLKATLLVSKIHKEFDVKIPLVEIFKMPRIRELAEYIKGKSKEYYISIDPVEKKEYYLLSSAQKRLYILQQMNPDSTAYNMPGIILLPVESDWEKIEETFKNLIKRHESLRTSFHLANDTPFQVVHNEVGFHLDLHDLKDSHDSRHFIKRLIRQFDLSKAPLIRAALIKEGDKRCILILDMHHIIADGVSHEILITDFQALYEEELPPLPVQYKDFSEWQNGEKEKENIKRQERYWLKEFEGEIPVLELPTDFPRPLEQSFEGNSVNFEITEEQTQGLKAIVLTGGSTLFMVLVAVLNILLSKLSGQEEIIVGTPIAARRHTDLEKIIGMFVNTLSLRNYPAGDRTFREFTNDVKERILMAFENQEYPFEELVDKLSVNRDIGRNPLFDIMLVLQNMSTSMAGQDKDTVIDTSRPVQPDSPKEYQNIFQTAKFDLTLSAMEIGSGLFLSFQYCTKLFKKETVERFFIYFKKIVSIAVKEPGIRISEIEIIAEEEKKRILIDFNATQTGYPKDKTISRLFEEQVERSPDNTAVFALSIGTNHELPLQITYKELNENSNRLAGQLRKRSIKAGIIVPIMVERSPEMITGIMAILKAGGAYLPIDPQSPGSRAEFMLNDSGCHLLLTQRHLVEKNKNLLPLENIFVLDDEAVYPGSASNPELKSKPGDLAYSLYTSGTTGKPRGVLVTHRNVVNLVWGLKEKIYRHYNHQRLRVCLLAPYVFDASVKQIFASLLLGHCLYIVPEEIRVDGWGLLQYYQTHQIDISDGTPVHIRQLAESLISYPLDVAVKHFLIGGETLARETMVRFFTHFGEESKSVPRVTNVYGPTECCVDSTFYQVNRENAAYFENIPIGQPMPNYRVYIVDSLAGLQPAGIGGELCVAGIGVARGYLNSPEMTAEKFKRAVIRHPSLVISSFKRLSKSTNHVYNQCPMTNDCSSMLYKTGDLARWRPDGNIEFLGRIDHQVKIRGYRIEPGEIESQLLRYEQIKEAVVVEKKINHDNHHLYAYIVWNNQAKTGKIPGGVDLREYLSQLLPGYMIPSFFVSLDNIPLTPNGKVDRKALPGTGPGTFARDFAGPRNDTEMKLVEIWSELLGIHMEKIGINDNFFHLGGHSLKATTLISKIHKEFKVKIPLAEMYKNPTIRELSQFFMGSSKGKYESLEPVEKKKYYELSSAQKRLYIWQQINVSRIDYNMPGVFIFEGKLDRKNFEKAFQSLIGHHETLRTSFCQVNGEVVQKIVDHVELRLEYKKRDTEEDVKNRIKEFLKPFDLSKPPLLRLELIELEKEKHFVLFDMHHIISDGTSLEILVNDFANLYRGKHPGPLPVQYKDYAAWQKKVLNEETLKLQERYWLKQLDGFLFTRFPIDHFDSYFRVEGKKESLKIDASLYDKIEKFCIQHNVTKFVFMLTIFEIVLARLIDQTDITTGMPVSIRKHPDLKDVMGIFLNVLLIRTMVDYKDTFLNHLLRNKQTVIEALDNQDYPYEMLNYKISENDSLKNKELFSILFNYLPVETNKEIFSGDVKIRPLETPEISPKYDMTLYVYDVDEYMTVNLVYKSNIYKEYLIKCLLDDLLTITRLSLENEGMKISKLTPQDEVDYNFEGEFEKYYDMD